MKRKHIIIILVTWAIIVLISISPDDSNKMNQKDAIELCRNYAHDLLLSRGKNNLLKLSLGAAYNKIKEANFKEYYFDATELKNDMDIKNRYPTIYYLSPLIEENKYKALRLVSFEELDEIYMVMTFAYYIDNEIVEIHTKGMMIFTIGVRYYAPIDKNIARKIIRKIANLPLMRLFTGYIGTTGRWRVINFKYNCNLNDYDVWLKKVLPIKAVTDNNKEGVITKDYFDSYEESMQKRGEYLHNWIDLCVEDQQNKIPKLYMELDRL